MRGRKSIRPAQTREFPVAVINDLYQSWKGTVRFRLLRDGKTIEEKTQPCEVPALGRRKLAFAIDIPSQPAGYQVEAAPDSTRRRTRAQLEGLPSYNGPEGKG